MRCNLKGFFESQVKKGFGLLTSYRGKPDKKLCERVACLEMSDEAVNGDTRTGEDRSASEDAGVRVIDVFRLHSKGVFQENACVDQLIPV